MTINDDTLHKIKTGFRHTLDYIYCDIINNPQGDFKDIHKLLDDAIHFIKTTEKHVYREDPITGLLVEVEKPCD